MLRILKNPVAWIADLPVRVSPYTHASFQGCPADPERVGEQGGSGCIARAAEASPAPRVNLSNRSPTHEKESNRRCGCRIVRFRRSRTKQRDPVWSAGRRPDLHQQRQPQLQVGSR
ncbi:protein of unknown function [Paraburkholderia dioscoreae]|uniref:Uncharacterized protein n=1 Tax=Paraburkholderia dioscoreae TaxID=2604047 RepID=A0A5Q4ZJ37_9BURK|nr:protein of unknown function [Paraburkholderia dioscoreae]